MSDQPPIASKWNARYAFANQALPEPARVLIDGEAFLPDEGIALDIACGRGGNAFYMAARGLTVHAWDISSVAVDGIVEHQKTNMNDAQLYPLVRDVVNNPPDPNSFDVIVVSRFLDRSICPNLVNALKPNGVLFYQTFTAGLSNPDYLLRPQELPALFENLQQCHYLETAVDERGFSEAHYIGRQS